MRLIEGGHYRYDLVTPSGVIADCTLGIPGWVNVENAVAAVAAMWCAEGGTLDTERLRRALAAFEGVKRRFEFYVNTPRQVYMDDYAHHPRELAAALTSVRRMFPGRRVTAVFQPHLYTRTRDFYREFAEALSQADEVLLLPIYPAREEPIEGIASEIIAERVTVPCRIVGREALAATLGAAATDVVVSFGAGNIDACCDAVADVLRKKPDGCPDRCDTRSSGCCGPPWPGTSSTRPHGCGLTGDSSSCSGSISRSPTVRRTGSSSRAAQYGSGWRAAA